MSLLRQVGGTFYTLDGTDVGPLPTVSAVDPGQLRLSASAALTTIAQLQRSHEPPCPAFCCGSHSPVAKLFKPSPLALCVGYTHLLLALFAFLTIFASELTEVEVLSGGQTMLSSESLAIAILPTALATALAAGWFICGLREKRVGNFYPFLLIQCLVVIVCILFIAYATITHVFSSPTALVTTSLLTVLAAVTLLATIELFSIYVVIRAMRALRLRTICANLVARHLMLAQSLGVHNGPGTRHYLQQYRLRHGLPPPPPSYNDGCSDGQGNCDNDEMLGGVVNSAYVTSGNGQRAGVHRNSDANTSTTPPSASMEPSDQVGSAPATAAGVNLTSSMTSVNSDWTILPPDSSAAPPAYVDAQANIDARRNHRSISNTDVNIDMDHDDLFTMSSCSVFYRQLLVDAQTGIDRFSDDVSRQTT